MRAGGESSVIGTGAHAERSFRDSAFTPSPAGFPQAAQPVGSALIAHESAGRLLFSGNTAHSG